MKPLSGKHLVIWSVLLTVIFELITVVFRFGFHYVADRDTVDTIGVLTGGIRIHHGFIGLLFLVLGGLCSRELPVLSRWLLAAGLALLCSDIIHHFMVLWPITGHPELHLFYPPK